MSLVTKTIGWCGRSLLCLLVGVAGLGTAAFLGYPAFREWFYRETSYQVILWTALDIGPDTSPIEFTKAASSYVAWQMYPGGGATVDADAWTNMVRGIGWCDQRAWAIGTFCALRDIPARLVFLRDKAGHHFHTGLEVLLDGDWRFLDPNLNSLLQRPDGSLATMQDLTGNAALLVAQQRFFPLLTVPRREEILEGYAALFSIQQPPSVWNSVLDSRKTDRRKVLGQRVVRWLYGRLGRRWAEALQDVYLALLPSVQPFPDARFYSDLERGFTARQLADAKRLYFQARNYHLYRRYGKAQRLYRTILATYPDTAYSERSCFWLGITAFRQAHPEQAIADLSRFIQLWPDSGWKTRAYEGLARAYELQGDAAHQRLFEERALDDSLLPTASRLANENI